jgi:ribonuclease P protein component
LKKRYLLPKSNRICKKKHFEYLFNNSKKSQNKYFILYFVKALEPQNKIAFIAGKKLGNAVKRNFCKRRLRELYRINQHEISNNFDLAFVAKSMLMEDNFWEINKSFIELLTKCGIYIQP